MKEISREWLKKAKDDLDVIKEIKDKKHLTNMVAFHAQQAIEKSLKAIIDEFDLGFVKFHQIERLLDMSKIMWRLILIMKLFKYLTVSISNQDILWMLVSCLMESPPKKMQINFW